MKKIWEKHKWLIIISIIIIYLFIGYRTTIKKSDDTYNQIVEGNYWVDRCKEENNYEAFIFGTPGAQWCIVNGEFMTTKPTEDQWYKSFYFSNIGNYNGDFKTTLFLWPIV